MSKILTPRDAARLIEDGQTITTSGFVGIGVPDELCHAIAEAFEDEGHPRGLTLVFAAGQGDGGERGLNRLSPEGLLKRVVGGHWGLIPKIGRLCLDGKIEGYNLPQGCISHLYRDVAAGKPGTITHVGLKTFCDPRQKGGKISDESEDLVSLIEIGGDEWLLYKAFPIHVALLRGTTADTAGNVSMENEALIIDNLAQAQAARNSGGKVIVQVERLAAAGSLHPRNVVLPSSMVDAIVVADPDRHMQTYATRFSPAFAHHFSPPADMVEPLPMTVRKVIARRAAMELEIGQIVNLGIGMPEGVADVAAEEGLLSAVTLTAEPGIIGGQPASGLDFGAAINIQALVGQNQQFDFYDGGGLDLAVLGMAQVDASGHVNVSRFGKTLAGAGGFINISQNAKKVVFTGTFTAGGLQVEIADGRLAITTEGKARKFLNEVEEITFSGIRASRLTQPVLYVTERCVFRLEDGSLRLTEVAPGIDIDRDILGQMDFEPIVDEPVEMDARIFRPGKMDLRKRDP